MIPRPLTAPAESIRVKIVLGLGWHSLQLKYDFRNKLSRVAGWLAGWLGGWLEKAKIKPTQPSWSWAWLSLAKLG